MEKQNVDEPAGRTELPAPIAAVFIAEAVGDRLTQNLLQLAIDEELRRRVDALLT